MWKEIIEAVKGGLTLIYGEAGTGKTNLVMKLMEIHCKEKSTRCFYISTEGNQFTRLVGKYRFGDNCYFSEALNMSHLLDLVFDISSKNHEGMNILVAIDSINGLYCEEAIVNDLTNTLLNLTIGILVEMIRKYGSIVLLTARVKGGSESTQPAGHTVLSFWSDVIIRTRKICPGYGELIFESGSSLEGRRMRYVIGDDGAKLVNESRYSGC